MKKAYRCRFLHTKWIAIIVLFFFIPVHVFCDDDFSYPEIKSLDNTDPLYRQLQDDVSAYYRAVHSKGKFPVPVLKIFQIPLHKVISLWKEADTTIFALSARLNIPYDTIASLNHIENPLFFKNSPFILFPNIPGIFIPEDPSSDLEQIMLSWRMQSLDGSHQVTINRKGENERFLFFPGQRFHPVERAYFLNLMFRFPLKKGKITSSFGVRQNPFSGHPEVHNGIDIGAPEGTEVYAVRDGVVKKRGYNDLYGNYILISHSNGYQSFYGHLKDFNIDLNTKVYSGMVIGWVGTTGCSTGPHLHFEIRKDGSPEDPVPLLQRVE
ncbi:MAG: M23 family metallopeptidase [Spirochaetales bacterium]|nr:M23 family metallopeptidase [Spirochaetales bacterium]